MTRPCYGNRDRLVRLACGSLRPGPTERLLKHIEQCPGCRAGYNKLMGSQQLVQQVSQQPTPELAWRQLEAQLHWRMTRDDPQANAGRSGRRPTWLTVSLAAALGAATALLVVAYGGASWLGQPRHSARVSPPPPAVAQHTVVPRQDEEEIAAVPTMVRGEIEHQRPDGARRPLRINDLVLQGARLRSGPQSGAGLQWAHGSGLLLGPRTTLEVDHLMSRTQRFGLDRGQVKLRLAPLPPGGSLTVVARGVAARVKGTVFDVAITQRSVDVRVERGTVEVGPEGHHRWDPVDVPAGHMVRVPFGATMAPELQPLPRSDTSPRVHLVRWPNLARMLAGTGRLAVASRPANADLLFDSAMLGRTNLALRGDTGRHLVELFRDGKLVASKWVEISATSPTSVTLRGKARPHRLPPRIANTIRSRSVQIRACYERHLKRDPKLSGRLTLRIQIDDQGQVTQTRLISGTFEDPRIAQCAQLAVKRWRFPEGSPVQVDYPFIFRPQATEPQP